MIQFYMMCTQSRIVNNYIEKLECPYGALETWNVEGCHFPLIDATGFLCISRERRDSRRSWHIQLH